MPTSKKNDSILDLLKKAFSLTWKKRFLWIFGFLILFCSNIINLFSYLPEEKVYPHLSLFFQKNSYLTLGLSLLFILILLALILIKLISQTAIIISTSKGKSGKTFAARTLIKSSVEYLKKLFQLDLLLFLVLTATFATIFLPLFFFLETRGRLSLSILFLFFAALILFFFIGFIAYFIRKFSQISIVNSNLSLIDSLEFSYSIFRSNWKKSLVFYIGILLSEILLQTISILIFLLTTFSSLIVLVLFSILGAYITSNQIEMGWIMVIYLTAWLFILILLQSFLETFKQTAWVLFFEKLTLKKIDNQKKPLEEGLGKKILTENI